MKYNIDDSAELTPEEQAAYQAMLQRAIAENRSINIYAKKKYSKPEQQAKHLKEQQNIMRLGLPATVSLWDSLDPEFEISNRTPSGNMSLGELYGMFHSDPQMRETYKAYGPTMGLNYDAIGNKTLMEMLGANAPQDEYKSRYAANVASTMKHEREHAYGQRRIPFGSVEDIAKLYASNFKDPLNAIVKPIADQWMKLRESEPILAKIYLEAVSNDPEQRWGLFEEMAARAIEEGSNDPMMNQYSIWKRTGLFE